MTLKVKSSTISSFKKGEKVEVNDFDDHSEDNVVKVISRNNAVITGYFIISSKGIEIFPKGGNEKPYLILDMD